MSSAAPPPQVLSVEDQLKAMMENPSASAIENGFGAASSGVGNAHSNASTEMDPAFGAVRNELAVAHRLAAQASLHPYQRQQLDELVKAPPLLREIILFVEVCQMENKLEKIITEMPPYEMSDPLVKNMKSLVVAVLLSPKLSAYKGETPKDNVIKLLIRAKHVPSSYGSDAFVTDLINSTTGEELTQARSKIKKLIIASIKEKSKIFDFATKTVTGTQCSVTVPLCSKLALLRNVHEAAEGANRGSGFWDAVDTRLDLMRATAGGDPILVSRALTGYLALDQEEFGTSPDRVVPNEAGNDWQQGVDDALSQT